MSQQTNPTQQQFERERSIFLVNSANVPSEKLEKGAEKTHVQYLIDDRQESNRFALRLYTIQKGGHTPLDEHQHEHQVYVLKGEGLLRESKDADSSLKTLKAGDAIFIPSYAIHQFSNLRDEPFVFLCVKGNPELYTHEVPTESPDDSEQTYC
jgi:quercetin dioxygenase-like cupin family protein